MTLDEILTDPEADKELRDRGTGKKKVTQEEHVRYVQERLLEACGQLDLESIERQYQRAVSAVKELTVVPQAQDISDFCTRNVVLRPRILGIFASALINTISLEEPIALEINKGVLVDYFGYKLNKNVIVKGDLGDHTAELMEKGSLTVEGNCNGIVGLYMGDPGQRNKPRVIVHGSIGDYGAIRYSGEVRAQKNKRDYYSFRKASDLQNVLNDEPYNLFSEQLRQLRREESFDITENFRRMVHPALVKIAIGYNVSIYEHQIAQIQVCFPSLEKEKRRIINAYERDSKDKSFLGNLGIAITATGCMTANPILFIPGLALSAFGGVKEQVRVNNLRARRDQALSSIDQQRNSLGREIEDKSRMIDSFNRIFYQLDYS